MKCLIILVCAVLAARSTELAPQGEYQTKIMFDNRSPYSLVQDVDNKFDNEGWSQTPAHYIGVKKEYGEWQDAVDPIISEFAYSFAVLQDKDWRLSGTEANISYKFAIGDVARYYSGVPWNKYTIKTLAPFFSYFLCGWTDDNQAKTSSDFLNPSTYFTLELAFNQSYPVRNLKLAGVSYQTRVGDNSWKDNSVEPSEHPLTIRVKIENTPLNFGTLADGWIQSFKQKKAGPILRQSLNKILYMISEMFGGSYKLLKATELPTYERIAFDCGKKKNKKICEMRILDDMDSGYNCLGWALGITSGSRGYPVEVMKTWDKFQTFIESENYLEVDCYLDAAKKVFNRDVTLTAHCERNDLFPDDCSRGQPQVAHVTVKHYMYGWSSKMGDLPLFVHDLEDLDGAYIIKKCYVGGWATQKRRRTTKQEVRTPIPSLSAEEALSGETWETMQTKALEFLDIEYSYYTEEEREKWGELLFYRPLLSKHSEGYLSPQEYVEFVSEELKKDAKGLIWLARQVLGRKRNSLQIFEIVTGQDCKNDPITCIHQWVQNKKEDKSERSFIPY